MYDSSTYEPYLPLQYEPSMLTPTMTLFKLTALPLGFHNDWQNGRYPAR